MPSTTPNFGFEYPLSSDPLADGAQSIQDFATTADNTFVDLKGGTTGQYLTKTTNTDMDFTWASLPATLPVAASTKYFSIANNSTFSSIANIGTGVTSGFMFLSPLIIPEDMTIDRIGVNVNTAVASSTIRLGLYTNTNNAPDALIGDYGTVSSATTGAKEITISQALSRGVIWTALVVSGVGVRISQLQSAYNFALFADSAANAYQIDSMHYQRSSVSTLPNPAGATLTTSGAAFADLVVALRRA